MWYRHGIKKSQKQMSLPKREWTEMIDAQKKNVPIVIPVSGQVDTAC